jgi:small multidrug resistance pump
MNWLYLSIAIVAEVIATSALKASEGFTRPIPATLVVAGYGVAFYMLSLTLRTIPMGVVYAIWSGAGIVLITLVGYFMFRQRLDLPALVGIGLIVAGVLVMQLFSKTTSH